MKKKKKKTFLPIWAKVKTNKQKKKQDIKEKENKEKNRWNISLYLWMTWIILDFSPFLSWTAISTSARQYLLLGQEAKSDTSSELSEGMACAQAGSVSQRGYLCVLHLRVPGLPTGN